MSRPDFVIVCDHGRGGAQDPAARFAWMDDTEVWYMPTQFTAAEMSQMDGDQHVHQHLGEVATRQHYEIPCQAVGCTARAYRSDSALLQTLFDLIVDTPEFWAVLVAEFPSVTYNEDEVTVPLAAMHWARDTARRYGLHV